MCIRDSLKPSIVYSVDDNFTTNFMRLLSILPVMPLYYGGKTKFTPIHVSDFADIIFQIVQKKIYTETIECIGPEVITFKVPMETGSYQYVCTFPGHFAMMRGVMEVE